MMTRDPRSTPLVTTIRNAGAGLASVTSSGSDTPNSTIFFPPELIPILRAREATSLVPPAVLRALGVHAVYDHLRFTVALELGPVSDACRRLHDGDGFPWMDRRTRHGALRILADEAKHAVMAEELLTDIEAASEISPSELPLRFLADLVAMGAIGQDIDPNVLFLFVALSETLISSTLDKLPQDERLYSGVREYAAIHGAEEARHRAFFSRALREFWPRLDYEDSTRLGCLVPRMLEVFLLPDRDGLVWTARQFPDEFGDPEVHAERVIHHDETRLSVLSASRSATRALRAAGALEDQRIRRAFAKAGLVA